MNLFNEYVYTVCINLIFITLISIIVPTGSSKRIMKAVISVFVMLSFIVPIKNIDADFASLDFEIYDNLEEEIKYNSYEKIIKDNIERALNKAGYEAASCIVKMNVDDDLIDIELVSIAISDDYSKEEVKNYLYNDLGLVAEVYYVGE